MFDYLSYGITAYVAFSIGMFFGLWVAACWYARRRR